MNWGIGARCLAAAIVILSFALPAHAGDPAIQDTNGLFSAKLGYLRSGVSGANRVFNGTGTPGVDFIQCTNNSCGGAPLFETVIFGSQGAQSGFAGYGGGQFAMPLGHDFGLQVDGELGGFAGGGGGDVTAHAFRGDPAVGLLGPMVNYTALSDAGYFRAGGEGQYYWGDVTLYANAGYQWSNEGKTLRVDSGFFGCGYVAWYPMNSLMLLAGGGGAAGRAAGFGQVEWQAFSRTPGLSFFAEGMAGSDDSAAAFAGVRFHFGAGNNLEMRHRHELPLRQTACGLEQFSAPGADVYHIYSIE